jgi:hypothetical protein
MHAYSRNMKVVLALGTIAVASLFWVGVTSAHSVSRPHKQHRRHEARPPQVLYVSNSTLTGVTVAADRRSRGARARHQQHHSPNGRGCSSAAYTTIGAAVAAASPRATIIVCPGSYSEDVVIPTGKPLTLKGVGNPIINALNLTNGLQILASDSTVEGFTIGYATGEGILVGAQPGLGGTVYGATIRNNTVIANDRGNPTGGSITNSSYGQCNASPAGPGDCGEGSISSLPTTRQS